MCKVNFTYRVSKSKVDFTHRVKIPNNMDYLLFERLRKLRGVKNVYTLNFIRKTVPPFVKSQQP